MSEKSNLHHYMKGLEAGLLMEMEQTVKIQHIPEGSELLRSGQYVKQIPVVLEGLIKVFTQYDTRELLLYYIQPNQSCVMSFAAGIRNEPSTVFARAENDSVVALLPADKVSGWIAKYPTFNNLFYDQYRLRYNDLIQTIHQVLFERLDERALQYLREKVKLTGMNPIRLTHVKIAEELGTAREVISRILKKLEAEKKINQHDGNIEVL